MELFYILLLINDTIRGVREQLSQRIEQENNGKEIASATGAIKKSKISSQIISVENTETLLSNKTTDALHSDNNGSATQTRQTTSTTKSRHKQSEQLTLQSGTHAETDNVKIGTLLARHNLHKALIGASVKFKRNKNACDTIIHQIPEDNSIPKNATGSKSNDESKNLNDGLDNTVMIPVRDNRTKYAKKTKILIEHCKNQANDATQPQFFGESNSQKLKRMRKQLEVENALTRCNNNLKLVFTNFLTLDQREICYYTTNLHYNVGISKMQPFMHYALLETCAFGASSNRFAEQPSDIMPDFVVNNETNKNDIANMYNSLSTLLVNDGASFEIIIEKLQSVELEYIEGDIQGIKIAFGESIETFLMQNIVILSKLYPKMQFFLDWYNKQSDKTVSLNDFKHANTIFGVMHLLNSILTQMNKEYDEIDSQLIFERVDLDKVIVLQKLLLKFLHKRYNVEKLLLYILQPIVSNDVFVSLLNVFFIETLSIFNNVNKTHEYFSFLKTPTYATMALRTSSYCFLSATEQEKDGDNMIKSEILFLEIYLCRNGIEYCKTGSYKGIPKHKVHYYIQIYTQFIYAFDQSYGLENDYINAITKYEMLCESDNKYIMGKQRRKRKHNVDIGHTQDCVPGKKDKLTCPEAYSIVCYILETICNAIKAKNFVQAFLYNMPTDQLVYKNIVACNFAILNSLDDTNETINTIYASNACEYDDEQQKEDFIKKLYLPEIQKNKKNKEKQINR